MSEFWIKEGGEVEFADGDIGDYNHEGVVIQSLQYQIMDKVNRICDPVDKRGRPIHDEPHYWDEWKPAVAKAYAQELIDKNPKIQARVEEVLEEDPDKLLFAALKKAGVKKTEWDTAEGVGDARDYAMAYWGWKTYRDGNVDTWRLARGDMQAIIEGLENIMWESGASEKKQERARFTINVFTTKKHFYMTVPQMKKWLSNPTAKITQDSPEADITTGSAAQNTRQQDLNLMHPHYRNRPGVNPFGDSVLSFKAFLEEIQ